jgi:hypothetical protein
MADRLKSKELAVLLAIAMAMLLLWLLLLFLPWIAVRWFPHSTSEEAKRIESTLGQLGTYGDQFGMLTCLFTGAAFVGAAYAVILQKRELHRLEIEVERTAVLSILQSQLSAYQNLAEHYRYRHESAGSDELLRRRSMGRAVAYGEMMESVLRNVEAYTRGSTPPSSPSLQLGEHPARVAWLRREYNKKVSLVEDYHTPFTPISSLLLELVQEVAALTELNRTPNAAASNLSNSVHAINQAVEPQMAVPENWGPVEIRQFQIRKSEEAFVNAELAIVSLTQDRA